MQRTSFAYRSWWLTPGLLALAGMLLALAGCTPGGVNGSASQGQVTNPSSQSTAPVTPTQAAGSGSADQGTLNGTVVAGPSCPIETPDYPCPPKPVPNRQVMIETPDGKIAATPTTDSDGRFSVNLAPGTYVLKVAQGASQLPIQRKPVIVVIVAGKTISVQIELDSGIR